MDAELQQGCPPLAGCLDAVSRRGSCFRKTRSQLVMQFALSDFQAVCLSESTSSAAAGFAAPGLRAGGRQGTGMQSPETAGSQASTAVAGRGAGS